MDVDLSIIEAIPKTYTVHIPDIKKTITIEAVQYTGNNQMRLVDWMMNNNRNFCRNLYLNPVLSNQLSITLPNHHFFLDKGDYMVLHNGEFNTVKRSMFEYLFT